MLPLALSSPPAAAATLSACLHCGTLAPADFCCRGCEVVHGLLQREKLDRYYELGGGRDAPATTAAQPAPDHKWLEVLESDLAARPAGDLRPLSLDIQGIHCAACVWLIEELFARTGARGRVVVNSALGKIDLAVEPSFALRDFVTSVERFGYRLGPSLKPVPRSGLLLRMGVCVAIAMNSMIFAIPLYAGLDRGPVRALFVALTFGLSAVSVAVGGSLFFGSAWRAARAGVLHIDLPIALGILLAFAGSTVSLAAGGAEAIYFDTLNVFIALMLVGRWLQERVVEESRRRLLASSGAEDLLARRVSADGEVGIVPCNRIARGDRLLVAAGDLVCVDARVDEERALVSLDWISGESAARELARGDLVPAGAFNLGPRALMAVAEADFADSPLHALLRAPLPRALGPRRRRGRSEATSKDAPRSTAWWRRFAGVYVVAVLLAAAGACALWSLLGDPRRALEVTAAVLIVTCPCAFGIATPLAYELAQAGLRRAGLHVRSGGFLDRALAVRRVVFDKTGTLTTGVLRVVDDAPLRALGGAERRALYNLVARSTHPRSLAVAQALAGGGLRLEAGLDVVETAGLGLTMTDGGRRYALGAGDAGGELCFTVDGRARARIVTEEQLRPDAAAEIARLRDDGLEVWILSGDAPERVAALAAALGVPRARALGGRTPAGKAEWLAEHDRGDTLFIGDGINDSLVVERATCSGTPAIDRPFIAARSDFYFTAPGLAPVRRALDAARVLRRAVRRNLALAVVYNAVTVSLAYAGLMSPLLCAVVMPLSSLTVVGATLASLSGRSRLWRS